MELIKPIGYRTLGLKKESLSTTKRVMNTWRKENSAIFCFILSALLGHLQHTIHHRS